MLACKVTWLNTDNKRFLLLREDGTRVEIGVSS